MQLRRAALFEHKVILHLEALQTITDCCDFGHVSDSSPPPHLSPSATGIIFSLSNAGIWLFANEVLAIQAKE